MEFILYTYFQILLTFVDLAYNSQLINHSNNISRYGADYGTKWIYFPDDDGEYHYINLTSTENDDNFIRDAMYDEMEFRLYLRLFCFRNDSNSFILLDERGRLANRRDVCYIKNIFILEMPLKIITHGWLSSVDANGVSSIKNAYLETKNVNVMTVDWSYTASSIFYPWAANATKTIGARIASLLDGLNKLYNVTGNQIHLIGHSLGAHVMGIAASTTSSTVHRVTGLDPARPFFEYPPKDDDAKLDSSDANFVDVIHTCGGLLGFEGSIGTADFFPNKGVAPQPGCDNIFKIFEACSHGRSFYYFTESIKYPKSFPAYQCQTWLKFLEHRCVHNGFMGESANGNMSGKYFLKTNSFEPFGLRAN
ncbi:pancreatic triacylglycerol lipase isoform X1 [Helicoverpa armigera]|uniref:pancreatic triacylglycerol lipase isoform X1 n=1 Tax=Helicoverpa armigera TaxID=29058 RepID=UPI0030830DFB